MSAQTETWPRPHRLTVDEFYRMADVGLLAADARVELIEGGIVDMAPIGASHAAMLNRLTKRLILAVGDLALVSIQATIRLSRYSAPQPDLALLHPRPDEYRTGLPAAGDVLLVIEVSDSTLRFDREAKASLYAHAGIREYWIADLVHGNLLVLSDPRGRAYAHVDTVPAGSRPIAGLGVSVDLTGLF